MRQFDYRIKKLEQGIAARIPVQSSNEPDALAELKRLIRSEYPTVSEAVEAFNTTANEYYENSPRRFSAWLELTEDRQYAALGQFFYETGEAVTSSELSAVYDVLKWICNEAIEHKGVQYEC